MARSAVRRHTHGVTKQSKPAIAFIGTGLMGRPMAMRVLAAGYPLSVWNRTREKTRELAARGARVDETPADAATGAGIVIAMLADGPAVTEVLFENNTADALRRGAIVVDMSSIPPSLARQHAARLAGRGIEYLDAPVSGGTKGATEGTLAIMVGGTREAFESARAILEVMGRPTPNGRRCGPRCQRELSWSNPPGQRGAMFPCSLFSNGMGSSPAGISRPTSSGSC